MIKLKDLLNLKEAVEKVKPEYTQEAVFKFFDKNKKKLENDMVTFHLAYKEKDNANKEIYTLQGMQDASEDEMISENYKNIVWNIVAILLVIGSIKLLK